MVQQYKSRSQFDIPYSLLCPVYFYRYPNPQATHVLSVDVISRDIVKRPIGRAASSSSISQRIQDEDEEEEHQHVLKTTRLILKKGTLPKWAPRSLRKVSESWVLEESEVELDALRPDLIERREGKGRTMRSWTRNLNHTDLLAVTESTVFREKVPQGEEQSVIALKSTYDVSSAWSFALLRNRIEKFGINRVLSHVDSSREGIMSTYARLLQERSGTSQMGLPSSETGLMSKDDRLRAALRPPFLDGEFVGPIARLRRRVQGIRAWWRALDRGGSGAEGNFGLRSKTAEELDKGGESHLSPTERIRKRFLFLRDQGRAALKNQQDDMDDEQD